MSSRNILTRFFETSSVFLPAIISSGEFTISAGHPPGGRLRKNSFCSEIPITDGERVYVYITGLGLFAYNFDGKKLWNTPLESSPTILDYGTASSLAQLDNLVNLFTDGTRLCGRHLCAHAHRNPHAL